VCEEVFDRYLGERPNQLDRRRDDVRVTADQLLAVQETPGSRTERGLRENVSVSLQYLAAWLAGNGAVGINNLMEDAATAEISRSQIWQWLHNGVTLDDTGEQVTHELVARILDEETDAIRTAIGDDAFAAGRHQEARELFERVAVADEFVDFLTLPAYDIVG
jgi:malate synthase